MKGVVKGLLGLVVTASIAALAWMAFGSGRDLAAPRTVPSKGSSRPATAESVAGAAMVPGAAGLVEELGAASAALPRRSDTGIAAPRAAPVAGVVRFADGSPVQGAGVVLADAVEPTGTWCGPTDRHGRFTTAPPPDPVGPWTLSAEWRLRETAEVVVHDAATPVELVVPLQPRLRGRVVTASGQPVVAELWAFRCGVEPADVRRGRSERDGQFVLTELSAGRWGVVATRAGRHYRPSQWVEVTVGDGCAWVDLQLRDRVSLFGVVEYDDGTPCPGASVAAIPSDGQVRTEPFGVDCIGASPERHRLASHDFAYGESAADGRFELRVPRVGTYDVTCWPPWPRLTPVRQPGVLSSGEVRFVVPRLRRTAHAVIEFFGPDGKPAYVRSASGEQPGLATTTVEVERERGVVRLTDLVPDKEVSVRARLAGYGVGTWGPWPLEGAGLRHRVHLPALGALEVVAASSDGAPRRGLRLVATREAPKRRSVRTCDAQGRCTFEARVPGVWTVRPIDGEGPTERVTVPEGGRGFCRLVW
ncbi:MAG: hypothetical protein AAF628_37245 [Planctomycetota bacterium]